MCREHRPKKTIERLCFECTSFAITNPKLRSSIGIIKGTWTISHMRGTKRLWHACKPSLIYPKSPRFGANSKYKHYGLKPMDIDPISLTTQSPSGVLNWNRAQQIQYEEEIEEPTTLQNIRRMLVGVSETQGSTSFTNKHPTSVNIFNTL